MCRKAIIQTINQGTRYSTKENLSAIVNIHMSDTMVANQHLHEEPWAGDLVCYITGTICLFCHISSSDCDSVKWSTKFRQRTWVHSLPPLHLWVSFKPLKDWDALVMAWDFQTLVDNAASDIDRTRLLAMKADDHGSEWIFALPISSCGLCISNKAIRIAISLRLELNLSPALAVEPLMLRACGLSCKHCRSLHIPSAN